MKSIILSVSIMMLTIWVQAQSNELLIKSNEKGLYFEHKVTAKENFYSVGRLFNVHPKHIATFNSLDMSKGLGLGQVIKIPLTDTNFNQNTEKGQAVYYLTGNSESLYRVSTSNHNVLMEKLRKWNHLSNDKVAPGTKLIVGYLVTGQTASLAAANPPKSEPVNKPPQENNSKALTKNETTDKPEPVNKPPQENDNKALTKNETTDKPEPKKAEVTEKKEEPKKEQTAQVNEEIKPANPNQGYFKTSFDQQIRQQPITKEQTLTSGIFKTASGWSDAKYYLLMDGVEPGTIVKVTNPVNNKMIYAKLLGEMSGVKANQGVNVRISNAAASALDIGETDKFIVKLNY